MTKKKKNTSRSLHKKEAWTKISLVSFYTRWSTRHSGPSTSPHLCLRRTRTQQFSYFRRCWCSVTGEGQEGGWRVYKSRNIRNETTAQWSLYINISNKRLNAICVCSRFLGRSSSCPSFLVVNTDRDLIIIIIQRSSFHPTFSKRTVAHLILYLDLISNA